jgi:hypothetical protein
MFVGGGCMQSLPNINCSGPLSRRAFLQAGSLAIGGLTLPSLLAARVAAGTATTNSSVILLYLSGGPSHLETYDLKPEAPVEYRSIFRPIATNVPGIEICELFPKQAALADKIALVRSLNHTVDIHSDGGIEVLCGKRNRVLDPLSQSKSEHPDFGNVASKVRGLARATNPPYGGVHSGPDLPRPAPAGP